MHTSQPFTSPCRCVTAFPGCRCRKLRLRPVHSVGSIVPKRCRRRRGGHLRLAVIVHCVLPLRRPAAQPRHKRPQQNLHRFRCAGATSPSSLCCPLHDGCAHVQSKGFKPSWGDRGLWVSGVSSPTSTGPTGRACVCVCARARFCGVFVLALFDVGVITLGETTMRSGERLGCFIFRSEEPPLLLPPPAHTQRKSPLCTCARRQQQPGVELVAV